MIRAISGLHEYLGNEKAQKDLENDLKYFHTHRQRMNYTELRMRVIRIGLGIVELVK